MIRGCMQVSVLALLLWAAANGFSLPTRRTLRTHSMAVYSIQKPPSNKGSNVEGNQIGDVDGNERVDTPLVSSQDKDSTSATTKQECADTIFIPGQAFAIVLAVTLFWPTLAGVRVWWSSQQQNSSEPVNQTRMLTPRSSQQQAQLLDNYSNKQSTFGTEDQEPPSYGFDDSREILELPRLSPAEEMVGAIFGPPGSSKKNKQQSSFSSPTY